MRSVLRNLRSQVRWQAFAVAAACLAAPFLISATAPENYTDARSWLVDVLNLPKDQSVPPGIIYCLAALVGLLTYWIYCMLRKAIEMRAPRRHWERRPDSIADRNRARTTWVQTSIPAAARRIAHAEPPADAAESPAVDAAAVVAQPGAALPPVGAHGFARTRAHLEQDQELDLFGVGVHAGYSARGVIMHRSDDAIVVRMDDLDHNCPWCGGDTLQAYTWKQGDGGYLFGADIREIRCGGQHCIMVLAHPRTLERKSAPIILRAAHEVELRFRVHSAHHFANEVGSSPLVVGERLHAGTTRDVSSAGIRIATTASLSAGDVIATMDFPPLAGEEIHARVTGSLGRAPPNLHLYSLQFTGLSTRQREIIARFVFRVQRENFAKQRV